MHVLKIFWNIHKIKRYFQSYYTFSSFFYLSTSLPSNRTFNNLISKRDISYNYDKKISPFFSLVSVEARKREYFFQIPTFPISSPIVMIGCFSDNRSPTRKFRTVDKINEMINSRFTSICHKHFYFVREYTRCFFHCSLLLLLLLFLFIISFIGHVPPRSYFIAMTRQMRAACTTKRLGN